VRTGRIEQWKANGRAELPGLQKSVYKSMEERRVMWAVRVEQWESNASAELLWPQKTVSESMEEWRRIVRAKRIEQWEADGSAESWGSRDRELESVGSYSRRREGEMRAWGGERREGRWKRDLGDFVLYRLRGILMLGGL